MTKTRTKIISGKRYTRYNGFATKDRAIAKANQLKDSGDKLKDGRRLLYDNARVVFDEKLNTRPYVVWVRGKFYRYPPNYKFKKGR